MVPLLTFIDLICVLYNPYGLVGASNPQRIGIDTLPFDSKKNEISDLHTISIQLHWDTSSYICTTSLNNSQTNYSCNTMLSHSYMTDHESNYYISIDYNGNYKLFIDTITIFLSNNTYYSITKFCGTWQYEYLKFAITTIKWNTCANRVGNNFKLPQYDNIAIGKQPSITRHTIYFEENILNKANKGTEGIVHPPQIKYFGIKVAANKFGNPQTQEPVILSLYWFNKFYQCPVHPKEANTTYLCNISSTNVSTCEIDPFHYGKYMLFMEKGQNTDALKIDTMIAMDETDTFYGINNFVISVWDQNTADICRGSQNESSGFFHTNLGEINLNGYKSCNVICIDSNACGRNKIFIHFPFDLYQYPNTFRQGLIESGTLHDQVKCHNTITTTTRSPLFMGNMLSTLFMETSMDISNTTNITAMSIETSMDIELEYDSSDLDIPQHLFFLEIAVSILVVAVGVILVMICKIPDKISKPLNDAISSDTQTITTTTRDEINEPSETGDFIHISKTPELTPVQVDGWELVDLPDL